MVSAYGVKAGWLIQVVLYISCYYIGLFGLFHSWINVWVVGITVCDPSLTRAIPERIRGVVHYTNRHLLTKQ